MSDADPQTAGWHLDKRVPIALIVTLLFNMSVLVIWGSKLDSRVSQLENERSAQIDQPGKIVRLETNMDNVRDTLKDINLKLDRLLEKSPGQN